MGKQKKNNNYVTPKNEAEKIKREEELRRKKRNKIIKTVAITAAVIVAVAAIVVGILFAAGAFDYRPEGTYDVLIDIEGYGSLHVELYGNDAPETVKHFMDLAESGYFNGKSIFKLVDGLVYAGSEDASSAYGIKGEFSDNGVNNQITHKRGILSMARGEDKDSAYGQFFIVRKNSTELDGKYAAFGKVTSGMEIIDKIYKDLDTDGDGMIPESAQPKITSISSHAHH